jgi:hypothetical protein
MKFLRLLGFALLAIAVLIALLWAFGALYFDGPAKWLAGLLVVVVLAAVVFARGWWRKLGIFGVWFAVVLVWWLSLKPTNEAKWQPDVAKLAWAEINGDAVTLHNVRNCDYRSVSDYTPRWETRTVQLSQITGIDLAINYWGSPWMAHPIVSFQFADAPPLCFSIETRKKEGQSYSAIGGLYRQFELTYVVAEERDVIRVRTNYRKGEEIYLYRTTISAGAARERFLEYVRTINRMRSEPRWYNAITTNCTTAIRAQHPPRERLPWDWRMLVNGKGDEMLYERRSIVTGGLPFAELKKRSLINSAASAANESPDFSKRIRDGRPGFAP